MKNEWKENLLSSIISILLAFVLINAPENIVRPFAIVVGFLLMVVFASITIYVLVLILEDKKEYGELEKYPFFGFLVLAVFDVFYIWLWWCFAFGK